MKINCIKGRSGNRVLCLIYGKLIGIMLAMMVMSFAASQNYNGREISLDKVAEWLIKNKCLANAIINGNLSSVFRDCLMHFKLLSKDKRNRKTSLETIQDMLPIKLAVA